MAGSRLSLRPGRLDEAVAAVRFPPRPASVRRAARLICGGSEKPALVRARALRSVQLSRSHDVARCWDRRPFDPWLTRGSRAPWRIDYVDGRTASARAVC